MHRERCYKLVPVAEYRGRDEPERHTCNCPLFGCPAPVEAGEEGNRKRREHNPDTHPDQPREHRRRVDSKPERAARSGDDRDL